MALSEIFAPRSLVDEPIIGMRFGVFFFAAGVLPNPLDIRFRKVSGLKISSVRTGNALGCRRRPLLPMPTHRLTAGLRRYRHQHRA